MMSLTIGLFTQVSGSGPLGPLVNKQCNCFTGKQGHGWEFWILIVTITITIILNSMGIRYFKLVSHYFKSHLSDNFLMETVIAGGSCQNCWWCGVCLVGAVPCHDFQKKSI